jgi:hypothetical protein
MRSWIIAGCLVLVSGGTALSAVSPTALPLVPSASARDTGSAPLRLAQSDRELQAKCKDLEQQRADAAAQKADLERKYAAKPDASYQQQIDELDRKISDLKGVISENSCAKLLK